MSTFKNYPNQTKMARIHTFSFRKGDARNAGSATSGASKNEWTGKPDQKRERGKKIDE